MLGQRLLAANEITQTQLAYALQKQGVTLERLGELLLRLGLVSERTIARTLAEQRSLEFLPAGECPDPAEELLKQFRVEACLTNSMLPLAVEDGVLKIAIGNADPQAIEAMIGRRTGLRSHLLQTEFFVIRRKLGTLRQQSAIRFEKLFSQEYEKLRRDQHSALSTDDMLAGMLNLAVAERATDIHILPEASSIHLSFRIDGVLLPIFCMERGLARLTAAIKVKAGMDIADNLLPQDGRFSAHIHDQAFDVRVSTSITPYGESMVMRLLPTGAHVSGLELLGFRPEHLGLLRRMFEQPHGIVLLTGPTGSGKTTTMYAGLKSQGLNGKSVLTVEDPIEYALPFASQTQVNRKAGYTFDTAVTHFLRHDPDIMLVGEIRDRETAEVAIRAAETGHLVLSTLHVNSAYSVLSRLGALGITDRMLADALIGIVNQRLARKLCSHCKQSSVFEPGPYHSEFARSFAGRLLSHPVGCESCRHTGYHDRIPVYEILWVDRQVVELIETGASREVFFSRLNPERYLSMADIVSHRLLAGEISMDEVQRLFGDQPL